MRPLRTRRLTIPGMREVKRRKPLYLIEDRDRHGNLRIYVRVPGRPKVRIRDNKGSPEFWAAYRAAITGEPPDAESPTGKRKAEKAKPGTLRGLCEMYFRAPEFRELAATTRRARRGLLESVCQSLTSTAKVRGDLPWRAMRPRHIRQVRDEHADRPEAANGRIKALRQLFGWAAEADLTDDNPARPVPYLRGKPGGFHTWTAAEVEAFEARHPVGTKARLALALLLYTGVRRSDVVQLGRQMERAGRLHFTETKGRDRAPKNRVIPMLPQLRAVIGATPSGHMTYLVTEFGRSYSPGGFGNWFRRRCNEAGLKHCTAHGLRKAGARLAAENGATAHQLMAIFGWDTLKQAEVYTREADRRRLADQAMHLLLPHETEEQEVNESVPLSGAVVDGGTKRPPK